MFKLLVVLFLIKLYARINIFQLIKKRHGQDIIRKTRKLEDLITKHTKIQFGIKFMKTCKRDELIPTFAKVNVAIKHGTQKLKIKLARVVMETEIQNKHDQKRKIKKQIRDIKINLKSSLALIFYHTLLHQINIAVKSKVKAITTRHTKKLINLRNKQSTYDNRDNHTSFIKNTVYNMSSYTLSKEEHNALAFGLDHHIPTKTKRNVIETEFELYFQSIHRYANEIAESKISYLKTKLRNICNKYNRIRVPYKYRKIVETFSNNRNIMLLRQDKGRGIVVINRIKYTEKCLNLLNTDSFVKLNYDPTKTIEGKIQRSLRKIKNNLTKQE